MFQDLKMPKNKLWMPGTGNAVIYDPCGFQILHASPHRVRVRVKVHHLIGRV